MKIQKTHGIAVLMLVSGAIGLSCGKAPEAPANPTKPPEISISQVVERSVTDYEEFTGRMAAPEDVEIRARVSGYLNSVNFVDGQEVKAGSLLFEIDPRTFEAEAKNAEGQKAQWLAKRDKAKADVSRYEGLVPSGAASAQDLDKSRAELGEAIAAINSADAAIDRAKLDLEFSKITAPIDGQVGRAMISKGNLVQAGTGDEALLTTIVSLDPVYVYFDVDERTILRFRERHRATVPEGAPLPTVEKLKVPIQLGLADESGFPYSGVIDFSNNRVDPSTGTVQVRGTFDNSKRIFRSGLFARVRVPVGGAYSATLVSETAIGTDQGQKFVLVVNEQNMVDRKFVKPGPLQDDGLRVISEGLKSGEWVVVNGLQRVRVGKPVTPQKIPMPSRNVPSTSRVPAAEPSKPSPSKSDGNH